MRADVEPLNSPVIVVKADQGEAINKIRKMIEDEWKIRVLEVESSGSVLITAPYHFATDTGFGMPPGGRKYYTQLRIEVIPGSGMVSIKISAYKFEMKTSYAFNQDGRVGTLHKHYPYENYPGMFDLARINSEMGRVETSIKALFR